MEHSQHNIQAMEHNHLMNPPMGRAGHDHRKMMIADFRDRFFVAAGLTLPIMLLSPMIEQWFHKSHRTDSIFRGVVVKL